MGNIKAILLGCASFIILFASCKKKNETTPSNAPPAAAEIMPLRIGNTWSYREINLNNAPNDTTYYTSTIIGDTMIANEHWYFMKSGNSPDASIVTNRTDGLYYYHYSGPVLFAYKYPAKQSDVYEGFPGDTETVISAAVGVPVPAGIFICYEYQSGYVFSDTTNAFLCPGIGLIKLGEISGGIYFYREELMSYHLN